MDLNMQLRMEVLEFSLHLEKSVNDLLLLHVGIFEGGEKTRLFSAKVGLTFKNKIDFLYDIEVFTKMENSELELFSFFRNKLMHEAHCSSVKYILETSDNSIKNRLKKFIPPGNGESEEDYRVALVKLYNKNLSTVKSKFTSLRMLLGSKNEYLQMTIARTVHYMDLFYDLVQNACRLFEEADLENKAVFALSEKFMEMINQHLERDGEESGNHKEFLTKLADEETLASLFGIRRRSETPDIDLVSILAKQTKQKD